MRCLAYHKAEPPGRLRRHVTVARRWATGGLDDLETTSLEQPLLLTFDDGHRSVLEVALPVLRERGMTAVVFVVAGLVRTYQPFWWDEVADLVRADGATERVEMGEPVEVVRRLKRVPNEERLAAIEDLRRTAREPARRCPQLTADELRELEAGGIEIGNHTLTHPCLDMCDDDTIRYELRESQRILTEILGKPPRYFAYPNGNVTKRVRDLVEAEGFEAAFLFDHRVQKLPIQDPMMISRLRVDASASMFRFRLITSGIHSWLYHKLRRDERPTGPCNT